MDYKNYYFGNFEELKSAKPDIAQGLLNKFGEGKWMEFGITLYPSIIDYAIFEITDGYYERIGSVINDFGWAPNLIDYFDFELFGNHLVANNWDTLVEVDDNILFTEYGW